MSPRRFPNGIEVRAAVELRAAGRKLAGYCAVFGQETRVGAFTETVRPGAFAASLASGRDVIATADHDYARVLARTASGTLRLAEDTQGLAFEIDVADTQIGRDLLTMAARGDLGGASFSFRATDDQWNPDRTRRELRAVTLHEIAVVAAFPAYAGTSVSARTRGAGGPSLAALRLWLDTV